MKNEDILKDAEDGRLKKSTVKALKTKLSDKSEKVVYDNKSINPHQEALAYAKEHNLTTNQAMKVLANRD